MSRRRSATPYAKALFEVASQEGRVEAVATEVDDLARMFRDHADLARVLTHPAVPPRAKRDAMDRLTEAAGVSVPVRKLMSMLADRDLLALLPELQEQYRARLLTHLRIVEAKVTTAVPLTGAQAAAVEQGLSRASGKQVRLTSAVDPTIIGGVVAQMGSLVFDGSVARQLERMRERLVAEA